MPGGEAKLALFERLGSKERPIFEELPIAGEMAEHVVTSRWMVKVTATKITLDAGRRRWPGSRWRGGWSWPGRRRTRPACLSRTPRGISSKECRYVQKTKKFTARNVNCNRLLSKWIILDF